MSTSDTPLLISYFRKLHGMSPGMCIENRTLFRVSNAEREFLNQYRRREQYTFSQPVSFTPQYAIGLSLLNVNPVQLLVVPRNFFDAQDANQCTGSAVDRRGPGADPFNDPEVRQRLIYKDLLAHICDLEKKLVILDDNMSVVLRAYTHVNLEVCTQFAMMPREMQA